MVNSDRNMAVEQTVSASISPIRVADEAFLIASTIDRCPKTMMLRELVMNALEAASLEENAAKHVHIGHKQIEGAYKLSIWNNGPGLSAAELHKICDLASSIRKETGLDANFGMGAKVASLPSNRLGLRYRSSHDGQVHEVKLVQVDGIYGRHRYDATLPGVAGEIADVTEQSASDGHLPQGDWTEVTLFGNRPDQNTVSDPYDGDPAVETGWIAQYLSNRFFRLPPGVSLTLPSGAPGLTGPAFTGIGARLGLFDRTESVRTVGGIVVHFGYTADPTKAALTNAADGLPNFVGRTGVVVRDELYGVVGGQDWLLSGPIFGFPFAARHCSVFIELPSHYGVRPEAYRQFLRFVHGDQRQVIAHDFAAVVRNAIPLWLREIIASYGLPRLDYVSAISEELLALLAQLGVIAERRDLQIARGLEDRPLPSAPRPPSAPKFEVPPEIISLRDPALIDERELQGRAARYYPQSHELFLNLTYSSVARLQNQLDVDFASAPDPQLRSQTAEDIASWVVTRQVGRALAFSLAKKSAGWPVGDIAKAQTPEALSLVADDYLPLLGPARRRMAEALGLPLPPDAEALTASGQTIWSVRGASELADAEQAARRALATPGGNPSPILRRVSSIEQQRGNLPSAVAWAEQAIEANPDDPYNYSHLAGLLVAQKRFAEAETQVVQAIALNPSQPVPFLILQSDILANQGRTEEARAVALRAIEADPLTGRTYDALAKLQVQAGEYDEALVTLRQGRERSEDSIVSLLIQESAIGLRRNDLGFALESAHAAVEAGPNEWWPYSNLARVLSFAREFDAAEQALRRALHLYTGNPSRLLRQLGNIEMQRGNLNAAVDWHEQAIGCDPGDAVTYQSLAGLLVQLNRLDEAETAARKAIELAGAPNFRLLRQLSVIEAQRGNLTAAIALGREALEADRSEISSYNHLTGLLRRVNQNDEAALLLQQVLELKPAQTARVERDLSAIYAGRKEFDLAVEWAQRSVQSDPADVMSIIHLAAVLQQNGKVDEAETVARGGLDLSMSANTRGRLLRQLSALEQARQDLIGALDWAEQAVEADPADPMLHYYLSGLYLRTGDLEKAEASVAEAVRLSTGESPAEIMRRYNDIQLRRTRMTEAGLI